MLLRNVLFLFLFIAINAFASTTKNAKIFVDIGLCGLIPKVKESNKCYDAGLKSNSANDIYKIDDTGEVHRCNEHCKFSGQDIDNKHGYGARFGFYKQVDRFYAVGIEGYSEWYNIEYKDDAGYKFQCTDDVCNKKIKYNSYKKDADGKLVALNDPQEKCSDVFKSQRFFLPSKVFKKSRRHQMGALFAVKMYTNTGGSYMKVAVGMGALTRKIPVAKPHKECAAACDHSSCANSVTAQHDYKIESVSAKKGLAYGVSLATKVSQNVFLGLDFLSQRNKSKENNETYVNNKLGISLSMELGK